MKKYVLDTNVLLQSPNALYAFDDNEVILPDIVLEELDRFKDEKGDRGYNARETNRLLEELRLKGDLSQGVKLPNGGMVRVEINHRKVPLPDTWDFQKNDNRMIRVTKGVGGILVSRDIAVRIKASLLGLEAEDYRSDQVKDVREQYSGRKVLELEAEQIDLFYRQRQLSLKQYDLVENQFVLLKAIDRNASAIGKVSKGILYPLDYSECKPYGISPRNLGQRFAQEALMLPASIAPLVILKGPAGTAKTFYSMAVGLEKVFQVSKKDKEYRKILITRGNVKMDNDIGFLKGDEQEKIMPLLRSFSDNLEIIVDQNYKENSERELQSKVEYLFDRGIIEVQALAYMRGRSLANTYIIIDEAQNLTPNQVLSIVTRVGIGSKVILLGDPEQIDNPLLDRRTNGLVYASERMKGSKLCYQVTFTQEECTRSELAKVASERLAPKGY